MRTGRPAREGGVGPRPRGPPVVVDDKADGLEEHGVLGVGVLHLLGLGRFLGFVQNRLQALGQAASHCRVFWARQTDVGLAPLGPHGRPA